MSNTRWIVALNRLLDIAANCSPTFTTSIPLGHGTEYQTPSNSSSRPGKPKVCKSVKNPESWWAGVEMAAKTERLFWFWSKSSRNGQTRLFWESKQTCRVTMFFAAFSRLPGAGLRKWAKNWNYFCHQAKMQPRESDHGLDLDTWWVYKCCWPKARMSEQSNYSWRCQPRQSKTS